MNRKIDEKLLELLYKNHTKEYKSLIFGTELESLYLMLNKKTEILINELNIRKDSASGHRILIIGLSDLIKSLECENYEYINFLWGRNEVYRFEVYMDLKLEKIIGIIIVKKRRKNDDELRWERENLGIEPPITYYD